MMGGNDDFTVKFLSEEGYLSGHNWPEALKTQFIDIFRGKLKGKGVKWVNPVVLIVFKHPETYFQGKSKGTWEARLKESLYQPVAVNTEDQKTLDSAYKKIIQAKNPSDDHLTPTLKDVKICSSHCYKCNSPEETEFKIAISLCNGANAKEKDLGCMPEKGKTVKHYQSLFKISNTIWFLPSLPFSLFNAKSDMYQDFLIGTYVGFEGSKTCTSTSCVKNPELLSELDWAIRLFFLRRLKDQGKEFEKTLTAYSKQMQMLRLLESPLNKLSEALEATQEHTQRLRSILYDPSRSIFSVAPRVMQYFEEGRLLGTGKLRWKGVHEPGNYSEKHKTSRHDRDVTLSLAAVVCEIFGQIEPWPKSFNEMVKRANDALSKGLEDKESQNDLIDICLEIIDPSAESNEFPSDIKIIIKALQRFKKILCVPYKDNYETYPIEPLLIGLYGSENSFALNVIKRGTTLTPSENLKMALKDHTLTAVNIFETMDLPVPRYSQWLALVLGVVAYAKNEKRRKIVSTNITIIPSESMILILNFSGKVFHDTDKLYTDMTLCFDKLRDISLQASGNFNKPFIDFALLAKGLPEITNNQFVISHSLNDKKFKTIIAGNNDKFVYSCEAIKCQS